MHALTLSSKLGTWAAYTGRKANPAFLKLQKKIFARDQYTCQFCGFQAKEFQEVVNIDQNYANNKPDNLVTSCVFCSQCFFLESVGEGDFGGGTLIYLPEIKQTSLNSFCHVLFCAMANATAYRSSAQTIYRNLKFRAQLVEDYFGPGLSNPALFGQMLIEYQANHSQQESEKLARKKLNLRLLPSRTRFKKQIDRWAAMALEEMTD